jgi:hypothetical protein
MSRAEFGLYRRAFEAFVDCAGSIRDKAECAAAWTGDVAPLLAANDISPARAEGMAIHYVGEVLRPNGGNSKSCRAGS